jgi:2',3'-cyclic-nucleotide 2'-phosphodiesterase (5'-nucleotidase family)
MQVSFMFIIGRSVLGCLIVWVSVAAAQPRSLTIFHVNDIHGHFLSEPSTERSDKAMVGGFASLSHYLRAEHERVPNSIFLDAGDFMTGNPICDIEYRGAQGGALVELLEMTGCKADVLGNHEFDISRENTHKLTSISAYPILCANIADSTGNLFAPIATAIYEIGGVRIGIIGLTLRMNSKGLEVKDLATTAQHYIDEMDSTTDLIILLTHNGVDNDRELARKVHNADVIVGGHSHTRLSEPVRENGVLIVQAGCYLKDLGVLDLEVAGDTVYSYQGHLIPLLAVGTQPDSRAAAFCDSFKLLIDAEYGQVIAHLAEDWKCAYNEESNVGDWVCDRLREAFEVDIALVNAGGLRDDVPAGPVTKMQVAELVPFHNSVVLFSADGVQLREFAKNQAHAHAFKDHGTIEMSGMSITYRRHGEDIEIVTCEVAGKPIDSKHEYRVASIDYVAISQCDRYLGFRPQSVQETGQLFQDFVIEQMQESDNPILSRVEGRLRQIP